MSNSSTRVHKKIVTNKVQPQKVKRIACSKCGELQVKIYPWSSFQLQTNGTVPNCVKCLNSTLKSGVV